MSAKISVMQLQPDKSLKEIDAIHHRMSIDNLTVDKSGDIWLSKFLRNDGRSCGPMECGLAAYSLAFSEGENWEEVPYREGN